MVFACFQAISDERWLHLGSNFNLIHFFILKRNSLILKSSLKLFRSWVSNSQLEHVALSATVFNAFQFTM